MRIKTLIALHTLLCSVTAVVLMTFFAGKFLALEEERHFEEVTSIVVNDFQHFEDNIRYWFNLSELVLGNGKTDLAEGAILEGQLLVSGARTLCDSPLLKEQTHACEQITLLIKNNHSRLVQVRILPHAEDLAQFNQLQTQLADDVTVLDSFLAVLKTEITAQKTQTREQRENIRAQTLTWAKISGMAYLFIVLSSWYWLTIRMTRPLQNLTLAAKNSMTQNMPIDLPDKGPREVREMRAVAMDVATGMEQTIADRTEELTQQQRDLEEEISLHEKTEVMLKENEELLRHTIESIPMFIIISRQEDGLIRYVNPAWSSLFGYTWEEIEGKSTSALNFWRDEERRNQFTESLKKNGSVTDWEEDFKVKNGDFIPISFSSSPIEYQGELCSISIGQDIFSRKQSDLALRGALDAAESANLAKSTFLANMSHEIRTPMNGIVGMLELLEASELTEQQKKSIDVVNDSAEALLAIINDILDLSKVEAGQIALESVAIDLRHLIEEIALLLKAKADEKKIALNITIDDALPRHVAGDPTRIRQILMNIIDNAIKFTDEGAVSVRVTVEDTTASQLEVLFEVADSGVGIDEKQQAKLFEPFAQADESTTRQYGGTGLGLSICKQLVEMMKGSIRLESKKNRGCTFYIRLPLKTTTPLADGHAVKTSAEQDIKADSTDKICKVLLVDDMEINILVAKQMLERLGHQVDTTLSGRLAVEMAASNEYDIIFMDYQMPEMNGFEATGLIRAGEQEKGLARRPIITLTANAMKGFKRECLAAGMDDYLSKPFKKEQLEAIIKTWVG